MQAPVNLENLRSMTDGDAELEKTLFEEFFSSFESGLIKLQANCTEEKVEVWHAEAHALKGMALNLGALQLGELCKQAQDNEHANPQDKQTLLVAMQGAYAQVKQFLNNQITS